jgi:hypothetical protein
LRRRGLEVEVGWMDGKGREEGVWSSKGWIGYLGGGYVVIYLDVYKGRYHIRVTGFLVMFLRYFGYILLPVNIRVFGMGRCTWDVWR